MYRKIKNYNLFISISGTLSLLLIFIFKKQLIYLTRYFSKCPFFASTGYLCPACGNTRSVFAIFRGDILLSFKYNIVPPTLLILFILFIIENIAACFHKKITLIPRSYVFLFIILALLIFYMLFRNFIPFLDCRNI